MYERRAVVLRGDAQSHVSIMSDAATSMIMEHDNVDELQSDSDTRRPTGSKMRSTAWEPVARGDDDEKRGERAPRPTGGGDDAVRGLGRGSADARDAKEKGGDEGGDEGADVAGEDETGETERLEVSRRRHGAEEDDGHVPDAKAENCEDVGDGEGGDDGVAGRRRGRDDEESTQTERGVDDAADDEDGPRRGGG